MHLVPHDTPMSPHPLATAALTARGVPADAVPMAAYMKTDQPFLGVKAPARKEVLKLVNTRFKPTSWDEVEPVLRAIWALPHREERYLAIDLARRHVKRSTLASIDPWEQMIREGA